MCPMEAPPNTSNAPKSEAWLLSEPRLTILQQNKAGGEDVWLSTQLTQASSRHVFRTAQLAGQ